MNFNQFKYFTAFSVFSFSLAAQEKAWTIDECVNYAIENNIQVRQSKMQMDISRNNQEIARWDYAPNVNFNTNYSWNFGLNIDPVTNEISQNTRQTANFGLSSTWVLYNGGRKYNNITKSNLDYLAARYGLEDVKNDISLNVASGFLQVLLNKEILVVAREQERISQLQVNRMEKLVEAGSRPMGDKLQLEAQLARDKQNRISAENAVTISKLQLANLLQLENPDEFEIARPELEVPEAELIVRDPGSIYATALGNQPSIKAAEYNVKSSEEDVEISRSAILPTLSLNAQVATNYSDQIVQPSGITTIQTPIGFVQSSGDVVISQPQAVATDYDNKPFFDQFDDNLNEFIGINFSLPLFNRMTGHYSYQNARINEDISRLQLEQEKNSLRQTIYQAHADAKASYNSYLAAESAVESSRESFKYAEERYNVGALNQFDYENAKNSLANAQSDMLQAKYDYIFKVKVLEFYLTNQITL